MTFRATPPGCTLALSYFRLRTGILAAHAIVQAQTQSAGRFGWMVDNDRIPGRWQAAGDRTLLLSAQPHTLLVHDSSTWRLERHPLSGIWEEVNLAPGEVWEGWALLTTNVVASDERWWRQAVTVEQQKKRADDVFWSHAPRLTGDWPEHWRRGWVYDMETTRLLLLPPGGIFRGEWPTWMAAWPRAVLAEGALDLDRLGLAEPLRAQDACSHCLLIRRVIKCRVSSGEASRTWSRQTARSAAPPPRGASPSSISHVCSDASPTPPGSPRSLAPSHAICVGG